MKTKTGLQLIAEERARSLAKWPLEHDRTEHADGSLRRLASGILGRSVPNGETMAHSYPEWGTTLGRNLATFRKEISALGEFGTNHYHIRALSVAGALIAAELDRLLWEQREMAGERMRQTWLLGVQYGDPNRIAAAMGLTEEFERKKAEAERATCAPHTEPRPPMDDGQVIPVVEGAGPVTRYVRVDARDPEQVKPTVYNDTGMQDYLAMAAQSAWESFLQADPMPASLEILAMVDWRKRAVSCLLGLPDERTADAIAQVLGKEVWDAYLAQFRENVESRAAETPAEPQNPNGPNGIETPPAA